MSTSTTFIQQYPESLRENRPKKKIPIGKEEVQLFFANDRTSNTEKPKDSTTKPLYLISTSCYEINT